MELRIDDERAALYELAYEEAKLGLARQASQVESVRTRAGLLLSAAAVATSFLGGQALRSGVPRAPAWIAIALFLCLGAATVAIVWPEREGFDVDPARFIAAYVEGDPRPTAALAYRELALNRVEALKSNVPEVTRSVAALRAAGVLLVVEIAAWIVALAQG
ncbi:MAG TPA: hypothetical protein VF520_14840 [Thermoleophilaceae bacterium]|jgi:hypothetical protein